MSDYSPKRRTALVFVGSGTAGAYHAGVLKALEEAGAKIDLVVGSGVGAVSAVFAAAAAGSKLYGPRGFWDEIGWSSLYRVRRPLRFVMFVLGVAFGVFLLPVVLALVGGVLFPLLMLADLAAPGLPSRLLGDPWAAPAALRDPYIAALAIPVFVLASSTIVVGLVSLARYRRRIGELFESLLDAEPATSRLRRALWELARGNVVSLRPSSDAELGKRYVAVLAENLGQPGFRELIGGEMHRLTESTLGGGCGLSDAIVAGAEQVIVVTAVPPVPSAPRRRRGLHALADATEALLERRGLQQELDEAERMNRIVQTVGHRLESGLRAWQDPATGRTYRDVSLYVVRPERRALGPLEWDGAVDPGTEVREETTDLIDLGYRDAYRLFIEPVLGAPETPRRAAPAAQPHEEAVEL